MAETKETETKRLARYVTVGDKTWGPDDDLPPEVAEKITNPKAWVPVDQTEAPAKPKGKAGTASGHKLASVVTVGTEAYGPEDFIPDDVAKKITNPKAWVGGKLPNLDATTKAAEDTGADATDKPKKATAKG